MGLGPSFTVVEITVAGREACAYKHSVRLQRFKQTVSDPLHASQVKNCTENIQTILDSKTA